MQLAQESQKQKVDKVEGEAAAGPAAALHQAGETIHKGQCAQTVTSPGAPALTFQT